MTSSRLAAIVTLLLTVACGGARDPPVPTRGDALRVDTLSYGRFGPMVLYWNLGVVRITRGTNETDSACRDVPPDLASVASLPGGHHFGGAYREVARRVLQAAQVQRRSRA